MTNFRTFAIAAIAAGLAASSAPAQQREHRITVTNGTDVGIEYFYVAGCGGGEWGEDRLGAKEIIEPGARRLFSIPSGNDDCCRDMRAKLQTGATRQKLAVDVCRESEWVIR